MNRHTHALRSSGLLSNRSRWRTHVLVSREPQPKQPQPAEGLGRVKRSLGEFELEVNE